jgi:hypothetical protein
LSYQRRRYSIAAKSYNPRSGEELKQNILNTFRGIATDAERTAIELSHDAKMIGFSFARFNCPWPGSYASFTDIYRTAKAYLKRGREGSRMDRKLGICGKLLSGSLEAETDRGRRSQSAYNIKDKDGKTIED